MTTPASSCAWCGTAMGSGGPHMRLVEARSVAHAGAWRARFHVRCGREILAICETRRLDNFDLAAPAEIVAPPGEPVPSVIQALFALSPSIPPKAKRDGPRHRPRAPAPPKPLPVDNGRAAEILDLAERGFTATQISARLRAPYAAVRAALETAR